MHVVSGAAELLRGSHAGGAGADDGDPLSGLHLRRIWSYEAHLIGLVGQRLLDGLDGNRDVLQVQRAGFLAGCGADAAGEFREIVGRVQIADGAFPVAIVDEVVPVGDLVVDRAARRPVAEGNAAVHAARGLFFDDALGHRQGELAKMPDAVGGRLVLVHLPIDLKKTSYLAHVSSNFAGYSQIQGRGCSQFSNPARRQTQCAVILGLVPRICQHSENEATNDIVTAG
jgi:hypothetical protein